MRNRILDAAEELFMLKGYDSTSTKDIMEKAGIARGTLYNHFRSKEDVLDGVIDRIGEQIIVRAAQAAEDLSVPVMDRLTAAFLALNVPTPLGEEVTKQMHKPQNALMHQKSQEKIIKGMVPILTRLLEEGTAQGIFHTEHGVEAVEMLLLYGNVMFDDIFEQSPARKQQRLTGLIYNAELMLGTKKGELQAPFLQIFTGKSKEEE